MWGVSKTVNGNEAQNGKQWIPQNQAAGKAHTPGQPVSPGLLGGGHQVDLFPVSVFITAAHRTQHKFHL